MALSNVRIKLTYGTRVLGIGTAYFIDASRTPIVMERRGGKFYFMGEVVVAETTQEAFEAACSALEASFDEAQSPALALRIETDAEVYQHLDPAGASFYKIVNYALLAGRTFTVTANGTAYTVTEGVDFNAVTSNAVTATNLAAALNAKAGLLALVRAATFSAPRATNARVHLQSIDPGTYSISAATNAGGTGATATNNGRTGFNARPRISKPGVEEDTALSRRYVVEVECDLPATQTGKSGRLEERVRIRYTDSNQALLDISGVYTALGTSTAYEQYVASVGTFSESLLDALGVDDWEGPFDVVAEPDVRYAFPNTGAKLGRTVRFSRTYQELLYARSLSDDVRLRRAALEVDVATPAPGDYGPGGKAVFRMRAVSVTYDVAVDKAATQDLKGIYRTVIKPFLEAEARKKIDGEQLALVDEHPKFNLTRNRVSVRLGYLAAQGNLVESTVTTEDRDEAGVMLVAVWDGVSDYSKQPYQGPKTFQRTVVQSYTVLGGPAGAAAGLGGNNGVSAGYGVLAGSEPQSFVLITAPSATEAAIDSFFGIGSSASSKEKEPDFPTSGGVPEPKGFTRTFREGRIVVRPVDIGRPGGPQIRATIIVKSKTYEYHHVPALPSGGGPNPQPSPGGAAEKPAKVTTGPGASSATAGAGGPLA